jgi:hypothetical protein
MKRKGLVRLLTNVTIEVTEPALMGFGVFLA